MLFKGGVFSEREMAGISFLSSYVMLTQNVCQNLDQCHVLCFHFYDSRSLKKTKQNKAPQQTHVASCYVNFPAKFRLAEFQPVVEK